ncbi:DUF302 domain-containing protein [Luteirhabdus pelagi]|uniref:DUF302 domain-containing protein n=1 Tax=Luteirhabdus pelagi TaxID=2792783 RepID=UPI0019396D22|nr:DUF302 domain-containing protein [Luteirhabdus pelagi]
MRTLFLILFSTLIVSCSDDDSSSPNIDFPETPGLTYAVSNEDFSTTYNSLRSAIQSNSNIQIIAEINHSTNAQNIGESLRNTRVIIFGNPTLGTPIMQENQLAGLDLPQRIMVYENGDGDVFVAYNSTSYLSSRYNVGNVNTLQQIGQALENFTTNTTSNSISSNPATVSNNQGIISIDSNNDFNTTYNSLRNAVSDNPDLLLVAEVNHQANAQTANLDLNPTRLIVFGNPSLGTPLMQDAQTTAIDLPQKVLVWEDEDGSVKISYNNPPYLQQRHGISTAQDENLDTIKNALQNLAIDAAN